MAIEIRILRPGDEPFLGRAPPSVFDDPIIARAAREYLRDPLHPLAVAMEDDVIIGFSPGVHTIHTDQPHAEFWINEVGMAPTHQGRSIGKALLQAVLKVAREMDCGEAWVLTERDNPPAMRLYRSVGGDEDPGETVMFTFHL